MKKIFPFAALIILFYCSCGGGHEPIVPSKPIYDEIEVNGVSVKHGIVTLEIIDSQKKSLDFYFTLIAANRLNDSVSCTLSGFPAGITDSAGAGEIKLPGTWFHSINVITDTGLYVINFGVSGPNGSDSYPINLHVIPLPDYAASLAGVYTSNDPCGHFSYGDVWSGNYTATVTGTPGMRHWLSISNFRSLGDTIVVNAWVQNYPQNNIIIPLQTTQGYTFCGTGTYGDVEILIQDTIIHASDTQTCITQLTR